MRSKNPIPTEEIILGQLCRTENAENCTQIFPDFPTVDSDHVLSRARVPYATLEIKPFTAISAAATAYLRLYPYPHSKYD